MSKIETEKNDCYDTAHDLDSKVTKAICEAACDYLGPNLFKDDASTVAYSDKDELGRIRTNFIKKKLNVTDSDADIDAVIQKIGEKYGMSNRNKKRSVVYACLMAHYGVKSL